MITLEVLYDALFSAVAGVGFGAISQPPRRAYLYIAILAAIGHSFRFTLIHVLEVDLATSSLFASLLIGFISLWFGKKALCPMTVLYIPALLPMIPGKIAYSSIFSLIMFLQSSNNEQADHYMNMFLSNGITALVVLFFLAVGSTVPMFLFPSKAYSMTRKKIRN